ncbi:hypothetical protein ACIBG0_16215 [Nocardia sp. NPDC050630]|uniref:hypothetical protein n=1 Tax=Nocardia sp. NPDC050630 TaxID=3364321 RepID=UPI0037A20758
MGTSKSRASNPRRQKMVSIIAAASVPLALVLGGTAIANVGTTSARSGYLQSVYSLPAPPPPHVPSPDEPLLEPHPQRPYPEETQPEEPPPDQNTPGQSIQ